MATKVKRSDKNRTQSSRELSDHITGEVKAIDEGQNNVEWDIKQGEVHSDIRLEDDMGHGEAVILRSFDFKANPAAFHERTPSTQELFNAHLKQIEIYLMKDGLKPYTESEPQLRLAKDRSGYRIVIPAVAMKGHRLLERPTTLTKLAHGTTD